MGKVNKGVRDELKFLNRAAGRGRIEKPQLIYFLYELYTKPYNYKKAKNYHERC